MSTPDTTAPVREAIFEANTSVDAMAWDESVAMAVAAIAADRDALSHEGYVIIDKVLLEELAAMISWYDKNLASASRGIPIFDAHKFRPYGKQLVEKAKAALVVSK